MLLRYNISTMRQLVTQLKSSVMTLFSVLGLLGNLSSRYDLSVPGLASFLPHTLLSVRNKHLFPRNSWSTYFETEIERMH